MTATYDSALPTNKDRVRLHLGDTNTSSALWSDEEINATFNIYRNSLLAAATLAESAAGRFSRSVTFGVEGLSIQNVQKADNYRRLAELLRRRYENGDPLGLPVGEEDPTNGLARIAGGVIVTGVSEGDMAAAEADTDRPGSSFVIGTAEDPTLRKYTTPNADDPLID